jgi:small-conductance mechanosensitive channel
MTRKLLHTYLLFTALFFCIIASAQQDTLVKQQPPAHDTIITDTVTKEVLIPLRQRVADEIKKNIDQLNRDKIAARQNKVLDDILEISQKANDYLESGIDTAGIASQLDYILRLYDVAGDGILTNKGTTQTERNLATTSSLLRELLNRAEISKHSLESYLKSLVGFQNNIDSLASDSILIELPSDSVSLINLISKITLVTKEMRPADTLLKKAIQKVQLLQTRVNFVTVKIEDGIEQIEKYREFLGASLSDKETVNLWEPVAFRRPMKEILFLSKEKARFVLSFYSKNNSGKIVLLFLLITGLAIFLRSIKKKLSAVQTLPADQREYVVLQYPILSSILIVLCVFQFIFREPPFIFSVVLWSISAVILTFLFRNFIIKYWLSAWFVMLILFFLAIIDNLILQSSRIERYGMLLLSLIGAAYGFIFLIGGRRQELKERGIRIFMGFFILMEIISAIANIYGRYNFAKSFLTSGIFGLVNAILFFWVIRMVNEMLAIAARVYKTPDKKTLFINFEKVGQKVPPFFYYLLVIGWFILFGRSFYFFRKISEQFTDFMVRERTIGESTFTIQSVFIFFLILFLSGIISNIVTFFASSEKGVVSKRGKKGGLGSWLLLIRISIITIGVLLAFAAAGIPMDRLAIILGALSVGIGFGLQSLINNLVSGLILAFEKPINVGDVVEFGGQSGTMKSIGFRSSIITTWEGADVIIPNGNLLNEQMINWTMGNSSRRVEIVTGVAYGTDLEKTKKLLLDLLAEDKRISTFPKPSVLIKELNSGAIELRVLFWIEHYSTWIQTKSDMIETIDKAFKKEGIKIPNPSQDVNIRSFVNEADKKK